MPARVKPTKVGGDGIFLYSATGGASRVSGAQVAETGFLKALAAHGGFARLRVFTPAPAEIPPLAGPVEIAPIADMPSAIEDDPPDIGFAPFVLMSQLAHLRDRSHAPFPILGYVHSIANLEAKNGIARTMRSPNHRIDAALCTSQAVERALLRIMDEIEGDDAGLALARPALAACPIGVDPLEFADLDRKAARRRHGIAEGELVLVAVGRLNPATKMDLLPLLAAFAGAARESRPPLRLLIAGQEQLGGYRALLAARAEELGIATQVTFVEAAVRDDILSAYAAADIFVSPSDNVQETFGITLVEALTAGLPVIASDWNGYRSILYGSDAAILIPTIAAPPDRTLIDSAFYRSPRRVAMHLAQIVAVDLPALRTAIATLAGDPGRRRAMAQAARASASSYRWKSIIERVETIAGDARRRAADATGGLAGLGVYRCDLSSHFDHYASAGWDDRIELRATDEGPGPALLDWLARHAAIEWPLAERLLEEARGTGALVVGRGEGARTRCAAFLMKHGALERR